MATVHKHVRRVRHVPHHDELAAWVNNLGLLGVGAQDEVVSPLRRWVRCPVGKEGGVAHARFDVARHVSSKLCPYVGVPVEKGAR